MMIDAMLTLADGQSSTVSVASTSHIDALAGGDAYSGGMAGLFFVIRIDTAFTNDFGTPTAAFELQTSSASTFNQTTDLTLVQSDNYLATELTAGKLIVIPVPPGAKRYIRGYMRTSTITAGVSEFAAGAFDMFITKDAPILRKE